MKVKEEFDSRGYIFRSHYPPGYRALAVNVFCVPRYGCEPRIAEVQIRKTKGGWFARVLPPRNDIRIEQQVPDLQRWKAFQMLDSFPDGLESIKWETKEGAMDWITRRLDEYGFWPW